MRDEPGAVRAVSWSELLPWVMIFRTFRIALNPSSLMLALVGVLLTPLGWIASQAVFAPEAVLDKAPVFRRVVEANSDWPLKTTRPPYLNTSSLEQLKNSATRAPAVYTSVFNKFTQPFQMLFNRRIGLWQFGYFLSGGFWTLLLWAFLGGAITRIAVVKLGREEHVGLCDSIKHAGYKFFSYAGAPLIPLIAATVIMLPAGLLGLMMLADAGVIVAGVLWVLALAAGAVSTLILLGLFFGWPLLWAAIAAECSDSFDAVSRCYMYVLHRPANYLFYVAVAMLTGVFAWWLVSLFAGVTIDLTYWAASWGVFWSEDPQQRLDIIRGAKEVEDASSTLKAGIAVLSIADGLVQAITTAFAFSFFWCATSAVYLLIRRDEDETEYDEVYLDEAIVEHGLPPLETDEQGVPGVAAASPQSEDDVQDGA